jgi:hypothetical protein
MFTPKELLELDDETGRLIAKALFFIHCENYPGAIQFLKKANNLDPHNIRIERMLKEVKATWGQMLAKHEF